VRLGVTPAPDPSRFAHPPRKRSRTLRTIEADLGEFDKKYKLAECTTANGCFKKTGQTGSTTELPKADKEGWSLEIIG